MTETHLDAVLASEDRMAFFSALAGAELFVLLSTEPEGEVVEPETFETEEGTFILAFDTEARLGAFVGQAAPYAALTGRALAQMLSGQGIGVALNPEVAPSAELLPAEAIDWLHETLGQPPEEVGLRPEMVAPPHAPEALIKALDGKLAGAEGLARLAYLVSATYSGGRQGHILAFIDALHGTEPALTQAVSEALIFSGVEAGALDVAFFDAADPMAPRLASQGLRFDLPIPAKLSPIGAPGTDPAMPPKLR